jgi:RHS repeat-associated protein
LYDPLNRITQANTQATSGTDCWGQGFSPDALANLGNISVAQCTGGMLSATVTSNNQFSPAPTYQYDAAGNMTADGTGYTYTFDAENRLTTATGTPLGNYSYTYDGNGLRVEKSNGASGTLYWRSPSGAAIAETDLSGSTVSEYVFIAGRRIVRIDGSGNVFFYNVDQVGTTRTITDYQGNICYDADFTPYGQEIVQHVNTCPQNYKFTGYERDPETGLDYAFARYYSSSLARFLSPDPLGGSVTDPQSLNRYSYVLNNPVGLVDPLGLTTNCLLDGSYVECGVIGLLSSEGPGDYGVITTALYPGNCTPEAASCPAFAGLWQVALPNIGDLGLDQQLPILPRQFNNNSIEKPLCWTPPAPAGNSVDANIAAGLEQVRQNGPALIAGGDATNLIVTPGPTMEWFLSQVWGGAPMDYKQMGPFDYFGNFNFGAVGAAIGLSPGALVAGANIYKALTLSPLETQRQISEINQGYAYFLNCYPQSGAQGPH